MPDHDVALALLERTGPMAVSSANLTGLPAATERRRGRGDAGRRASPWSLDAGPSPEGEASTILDVRGAQPRVLRRGALSVAELDEVLEPLGCAVVDETD